MISSIKFFVFKIFISVKIIFYFIYNVSFEILNNKKEVKIIGPYSKDEFDNIVSLFLSLGWEIVENTFTKEKTKFSQTLIWKKRYKKFNCKYRTKDGSIMSVWCTINGKKYGPYINVGTKMGNSTYNYNNDKRHGYDVQMRLGKISWKTHFIYGEKDLSKSEGYHVYPKKYLLKEEYIPYGKPNGKKIVYHSDGNVEVVYNVKNGKIVDGKYKHTPVSNGIEHKEEVYKNNNILSFSLFRDNIINFKIINNKDGYCICRIRYYTDGNKYIESYILPKPDYYKEVKHGITIYYNEDGSINKEETYDNGKLIKTKKK